MATQQQILTRLEDGKSVPIISNAGVSGTEVLNGSVGRLAIGKVGGVFETAYGPVTRPVVVTTAMGETKFGTYITGEGILVNPEDCVGVGAKFDTVTTLKPGQTGSALVSGGAVVWRSQVDAIAAAMNVQHMDDVAITKPGETGSQFTEVKVWTTAGATIAEGEYLCNTATGSDLYVATADIASSVTTWPSGSVRKIDAFVNATATEFSPYGDYTKPYNKVKVTENSTATYYTNLAAIPDEILAIEVNGFDPTAA